MPSFWDRFRRRDNVGDVQSGSHTLRSHGWQLIKIHKYDWLALVLVGVLTGIFHLLPTFHRYVNKEMLSQLDFPLKSITVPMWVVPIFCILLPFIIFAAVYYRRRDVYDLHQAVLGLLFSCLVAGAITGALKDIVGRPRPDFFWMCFPDGRAVFNQVTGDVICHGKKNTVKDAYRSFPSGHSAWSFAGLTFLSLYLAGKLRLFDRRGHLGKVCIVLIPLGIATLIGISLIDDYVHNWTDVFAGAIIGLPPPHHPNGWAPWAYFKMLDDTRAGGNPAYIQNQRAEGTNGWGLPGAQQRRDTLEDLESGRAPATGNQQAAATNTKGIAAVP